MGPRHPRDIVAIIVDDGKGEERLNLRGSTPKQRFSHLCDAMRRLETEWLASELHMEPTIVAALQSHYEAVGWAAQERKRRGGRTTVKKLKARAAENRAKVLAVHHAGYPTNLERRHRTSYIAKKTGLSAPTVRKYLPRRVTKK